MSRLCAARRRPSAVKRGTELCYLRARRKPGANVKASLRATSVLTAVFVLASGALPAQTPAPQPAPLPAAIAAPKDIAYRGTLRLSVDATDLDRRIFRVHETIDRKSTRLNSSHT